MVGIAGCGALNKCHKQLFDLLHNKITYVGVTSKNIVLLQNMSKGNSK